MIPPRSPQRTSASPWVGTADFTLQTADAVLVRDDLAALPALPRLSRTARRAVVHDLILATVAIIGLVAWDLIGTLPLPLGVLGHEGRTVLIGLNGLRLLRNIAWQPSQPRRPNAPRQTLLRAAFQPGGADRNMTGDAACMIETAHDAAETPCQEHGEPIHAGFAPPDVVESDALRD